MKLIFKYLGLFLFLSLAVTSCKKDINMFTANEISLADFGREVSADFGGIIMDEAGNTIQDVEITIGDITTTTDENGIFLVRDAKVLERKAYIKATKAGYFNGSRTMVVQSDKLHDVRIQLLQKTVIDNFETADGGTVEFERVELTFPADGIKLKDGGTYSGTVNVAAKYLDPNQDATFEQMPGDLRGIREDGSQAVLGTYGMMAVELIGANGEELQVADGAEVTVKTPVPAGFGATAPATMPLWHFDEVEGMWIEEGEATLDGDYYIGTVTHFSFWNHDFPYPLVNIKGRVLDKDGNPLQNVRVMIQIVGEKFSGSGLTNDDGFFCGLIPKDYELEVTVFGYSPCGSEILYEANLGTFTEDVTLADIVIDPDPSVAKTVSLSGRLINCDDGPVTNGYVRVNIGRQRYTIFVDDMDGTFEFTTVTCDPSIDLTVKGIDLEKLKTADEQTFTVSNDVMTGDIRVCDDLDEYMRYTLDSNPEITIPDYTMGPDGGITYMNAELDSFMRITFAVEAVGVLGTFPLLDWQANGSSLSVDEFWNPADVTVQVTYTTYDTDPGGYIIGTFDGDFREVSPDGIPGDTHTLSGRFRKKRN